MEFHSEENRGRRHPQHHLTEDQRIESPPRFSLPQRQSSRWNDNHNADNDRGSPQNHSRINHHSHEHSSHAQAMERVTFHLHSRVCNFGLQHTSHRFRTLVEHLLLVLAICCAGALFMLHRTFVTNITTGTCLDRLDTFDPSLADITHLVILPHNSTRLGEEKSYVLWKGSDPASCTPGTKESPEPICLDPKPIKERDGLNSYELWLESKLRTRSLPVHFSYSTTKAYLMLPEDHPWWSSLRIQYILVAPSDPQCFGEPFVQFLLWKLPFIGGGDTVLWNWLKTFPYYEQPGSKQITRGFVYNPRNHWLKDLTGRHDLDDETSITYQSTQGERLFLNETGSTSPFPLKCSQSLFSVLTRWKKSFWIKIGVFVRTSFLFFFCTTLVSFTLRETQERMLEFTQELSRRVRQSMSLSDLITTHLAQNLLFVPIMLGMMFFLIEFYRGDKVLAFGISSIIWCVEGFSLVCLRSSQGLNFFPYFFFLLFLLFHVYQSAFPDHGFVYLALKAVWCFILHSMVFFWHRYELPALVFGAVTIDRPRMNMSSSSPSQRHHDPPRERTGDENDEIHRSLAFPGATSHEPPSSRRNIDDPRLTAPLISSTQTTSTPAVSRASMENSSVAARHSVLRSGSLPMVSRHSFLSTASSRRTSDLYRHNQEDDNSTGSHLYFMGGEVVVHRQRGSHQYSNATHTSGSNIHTNGREASPPTLLPRGNSFGNPSNITVVEEGVALTMPISRIESNFSLLSSNSIGLELNAGRGSGSSDAEEENDPRLFIDSTEASPTTAFRNDDCFGVLPNNGSMETVPVSNCMTNNPSIQSPSTTNHQANSSERSTNGDDVDLPSTRMEQRSTPRHRNTQHSFDNPTDNGIHFQRRPPTFPELSRHKT